MLKQSANIPAEDEVKAAALRRQRCRFALAAGWSVMSLAVLCWSLSGLTIDRTGGADAAANNLRNLSPYWIGSALGWTALTWMWLILPAMAAPSVAFARSAIAVIGIAVAARAIVLVAHEPALSDDVYRYVFDGRNVAHGLNPYLTDPDARFKALTGGGDENWSGERGLVELLAFPEITTPYLPTSQYVFGALGQACEWGGWVDPSSSARVFRVGFTLIEVALMLMLLVTLKRRGLNPWWLALYAWHPLPMSEIAGSGHQDVIGIAPMVLALVWASLRDLVNPGQARGYLNEVGWSAPLAAAAQVKPLAGLAGLMILRRRPMRAWITSVAVGAMVCVILALPLRFWPGQPAFREWKATADWMAEKAAHFGGVCEPVLCVVRHAMPDGPEREPGFNLEQEWLARRICLGMFAMALSVIWLRARDAWRATATGLLLLTLCSTTAHPWYLLWGFALFAVGGAGAWAMWVYSLTITWGYVVFVSGKGHALGVEWTVVPWVIALAYVPVLVALVADIALHCRGARAAPQAAAT